MMGAMSCTIMQSLREIDQRAPAVGAKIWCLYVFTGRIAAKRQTAGVVFTQRPKISIFTPQWRLFAPIHVKLGIAERHVGPLGLAKFHANRCTGVGTRPPNGKISNFW